LLIRASYSEKSLKSLIVLIIQILNVAEIPSSLRITFCIHLISILPFIWPWWVRQHSIRKRKDIGPKLAMN
jgi:hypothetical protein